MGYLFSLALKSIMMDMRFIHPPVQVTLMIHPWIQHPLCSKPLSYHNSFKFPQTPAPSLHLDSLLPLNLFLLTPLSRVTDLRVSSAVLSSPALCYIAFWVLKQLLKKQSLIHRSGEFHNRCSRYWLQKAVSYILLPEQARDGCPFERSNLFGQVQAGGL